MSTEKVWSARVDWATTEYSEDELAALAESLAAHSGVVSTDVGRGRASAQLTVQAPTLRQAIDLALTAVRDAVHLTNSRFSPLRIDVVDEPTFHAELSTPTIPTLVGYAEIADMAGISRQRAREVSDSPGFPPAVTETSSKGPLRIKDQVAEWIRGWDRRPGRPPAAGRPKK